MRLIVCYIKWAGRSVNPAVIILSYFTPLCVNTGNVVKQAKQTHGSVSMVRDRRLLFTHWTTAMTATTGDV